MRRTILLATILATAAAAGCAKADNGPGSPIESGDKLSGRTFLSTSVTEDGKAKTLAPQTRISLNFDADKLGANAGCNGLFGTLKVDGDRLVITDMGGTDMACDQARMDQDTWLTKFLTSRPQWQLNGDDLTLRNDTIELKLLDRTKADPDRALQGTRWNVDSLLDGQSVSSVPAGAFLEFSADNRVSGSTGCNRLNGSATATGDKISFGPIITTKMACSGELNKLEASVLAALKGEVTMKITANRLELTTPDGKGLHLRAA